MAVRNRRDRNDAVLFRAAAVVERRHEGAQTNAGRAEGVAFVDLEKRVELSFGLEQALHLLARHGVETAAEAHQLHDFDVGVLERVFGRAVESAVEGPLIDVDGKFREGFAHARENRVLALEVDEGRHERNLREGREEIEPEHLRIAPDHRAGIAGVAFGEGRSFARDGRKPDAVDPFFREPRHVAVSKLRGPAKGLRGNRFGALRRDRAVRGGREHDLEAEFRKERVPEGIVFVDVENARNPDRPAQSLFENGSVKEERRLFVVEGDFVLRGAAERLQSEFAAVPAYELFARRETVERQAAVIAAAAAEELPALYVGKIKGLFVEFGHGRFGRRAFLGEKGRPVGAHVPSDVGADHFAPDVRFKGAQDAALRTIEWQSPAAMSSVEAPSRWA